MLKTENTIGIIGGTFDPIHNGHLITARKVLEIRNLQKILFIPCYISPHKTGLKNSNSAHRTEMLKAAIKDFDYFGFSDYELQKGGISYTIETIKYLRNIYQNIELIIGYDNYACFDRWHKPEEILSLAKVIVMMIGYIAVVILSIFIGNIAGPVVYEKYVKQVMVDSVKDRKSVV